MSTQYYTGIGSRETPPGILKTMTHIATFLSDKNWILRSGHAPGADLAFEQGANWNADIYLPWHGFNNQTTVRGNLCTGNMISEAMKSLALVELKQTLQGKIADSHLQNILYGKESTRLLQTRNVFQILGHTIPIKKSEFVVFWAKPLHKDSSIVMGGTNTACQVALNHYIPVYNLYYEEQERKLFDYIGLSS